ncbi:MAG: FadR/GntR family transcriptional regulator [Polyangiales bacterium]
MPLTVPDPDSQGTTGVFRAEPPVRQRVADQVFESLARGILNDELKPGEPLATQRDLAKQFNVSALVVRQAIHRLEDLGLVRVRQGSTTIVLDPNESTDIRLIQLRMEISEPGPALATAALENQLLFMLPLLVLAERRITEQELGVLRYITERLGEQPDAEATVRFRLEYWRQIAKATQNTLFQQQVRWWSTMIGELERRGRSLRAPSSPLVLAFFRKLNEALAKHEGTVQLYLDTFRPVLEWLDGQRGLPAKAAPKKD